MTITHDPMMLLRRAVQQPISALTAAEVESPEQAANILASIRAGLGEDRPFAEVHFTGSEGAGALQERCKMESRHWPPEAGLLAVIDEGGMEEIQARRFWSEMNALREGWDALGCHVIFFLLPDNYRFLTIIADHLADWMPLKLRFPIQDDRRSHIRRHGRSPGIAGDFMSPLAAKQTLATLEILLKEALEKGMDRKRLVARFYLPMFEAALILGHFGKADRLRHHIPETDVPQSDRLNWRRYNAALDAHYSHGRSSS